MLLLWSLCLLWVCSVAHKCEFNYSSLTVPSVLDSLECHNNYRSYFHCTWTEPEHNSTMRLQLFFHKHKTHECEDYPSDREGIRACRYQTKVFSPGTKFTVFFDSPRKLCSSIQTTRQNLSLLLRASSPVTLTTSSPYPQSSALDDRTVELSNMEKRLDEEKLIEGPYEATARASGLLPHKNDNYRPPSITGPEQPPRVTCVQQEVQGKQETWCSWEQSVELGHFISYHLVCHRNHMVTPEECCEDLKVKTEHMKDTAQFSCRVVRTPSSTVLLELLPKRNAKWLKAVDNVRPDPPTGLNVTKKGQIYVVKWTKPKIRDFTLNYEVRYYSQENEEDAKTMSSKECSTNIRWSSLQPSRTYWVRVRALVGSTPSEWSPPEKWTVDAATWQNWIYVSVALVVSALFIKLLVVPTCRRRVVLWVESVPSPDKSKAVLDIKTVKIPKLMVSEETYRCKVMDMESVSTCYSITTLWPDKRLDSQMEDTEDEGVWSCDNLPVSPLDKSSLSFSGPYILCPPIESKRTEKSAEVSWPAVGCPVAVTSQTEEGYVRLPCPAVSASMEHLPSQNHSSADDGQSSWDTQAGTEEEDQHSLTQDCSFEAFWPQGGAILGSGYCQLPSDFTHRQIQS